MTSPLGLAKVHKATEEAIQASGLTYTFLRNGMYHENQIYELTGAVAWTFDEFAALVAEATGKPFVHQNIPAAELTTIYVGAGLPDFLAEVLTDIYVNIGQGALADVRPDLEKLIGRPASPLVQATREAVTS